MKALWVTLAAGIFVAPWALPIASPTGRFVAALAGLLFGGKALDVALLTRRPAPMRLVRFALWPAFSYARVDAPLAPALRRERILGFALGPLKALAGLALLAWAPARGHAALDHVCKLLEIYLIASGLWAPLVALAACFRYDVDPLFNWPIAARSVLDFWRRYDVPVHRFLLQRIFRPVARRSGTRAGVAATFAGSGVLHAYIFAVVSSVGLWQQVLFFALHGAAALGTERALRRAPRALAVALTVAFVAATTPLFMVAFDHAVPMHGAFRDALAAHAPWAAARHTSR